MNELEEFSEEERILFGLEIIEEYRNKKRNMVGEEKKKFKKEIIALRKKRDKLFYDIRKS